MVPIDTLCYQDGSVLVPIGTHCYLLVPIGNYWYLLVPMGTHWYLLVPIGKWHQTIAAYRYLRSGASRYPRSNLLILVLIAPFGTYDWVPFGTYVFAYCYLFVFNLSIPVILIVGTSWYVAYRYLC